MATEATTTEAAVTETPETQTQETQTQETKTETQTKAEFDPKTLPAEAQEYYQKRYGDYETHKNLAEEYKRLAQNPLFREWYTGLGKQSRTEPPAPKKLEISDDEFVSALSDKSKFAALVEKMAHEVATQKLGPQLQQTQFEMNVQKRTNEINVTAAKYPDFVELDKKGLIEPILLKYPNLGIEDAYWLAKRHTFNDEVDKRARGVVEQKKKQSTERPGSTSGGRSSVVKVKSSEEAMELAYEAAKAGKPAPEFEYE